MILSSVCPELFSHPVYLTIGPDRRWKRGIPDASGFVIDCGPWGADSRQEVRGVDEKVFGKKFVESEVGGATFVIERPVCFGPFPLPRFISLAAPFFVERRARREH
jgi:hypothetical protein